MASPADGPVPHRGGADTPVPLQGRPQQGLGQVGGRGQHLATVEGGPPERLPDIRAAGHLARRGSNAEATTTPATAEPTSTETSSARLVGSPISSPRSASTS